jgi:hypothetical protein
MLGGPRDLKDKTWMHPSDDNASKRNVTVLTPVSVCVPYRSARGQPSAAAAAAAAAASSWQRAAAPRLWQRRGPGAWAAAER